MTGSHHYSFVHVKRSLGHFIVGKVGSGLVGLTLLLLTVRVLAPTEYGAYVTFMALLEMTQLVSNCGLFAIAQRYVADCRINGSQRQLRHLVSRICFGRILTLLIACGGLHLAMPKLLVFLRIQGLEGVFITYLLVILAEGSSRYIDLIFESLLLQGRAQVSIFIRNASKLSVFCAAVWVERGLGLDRLVKLEAITAVFGLTLSLVLIAHYFWTKHETEHPEPSKVRYAPVGMVQFSLQFYLAQVIGQTYGADAIKLIVARTLGLMEAAIFGFAYSINVILQRYLPAYLLLGMMRPLFVAKKSAGADFSDINRMANLVFKVNVFCLAPLTAFLVLCGTEFSIFVSGGKYPHAGGLLVALCLLLILQTLHVVLGLLAIATERAGSNLLGTIAGTSGVIAGVWLAQTLGIYGLVTGLMSSEILWCFTVWLTLYLSGFHFRLDWLGFFKVIIAAVGVVAILQDLVEVSANAISLLTTMGLVLTCFIGITFAVKPFRSHERTIINRFLPKPIFVW